MKGFMREIRSPAGGENVEKKEAGSLHPQTSQTISGCLLSSFFLYAKTLPSIAPFILPSLILRPPSSVPVVGNNLPAGRLRFLSNSSIHPPLLPFFINSIHFTQTAQFPPTSICFRCLRINRQNSRQYHPTEPSNLVNSPDAGSVRADRALSLADKSEQSKREENGGPQSAALDEEICSDYFSDELGAMNMGMTLEVPEGVIQLNVGGTVYLTTFETLQRDQNSLLAQLLTPDGLELNSKVAKRMNNGTVFIDRDGELFAYILDYLRSGKLLLPENFRELARLREEVQFYQLEELMQQLIPYYNLKYPPRTPTGSATTSIPTAAAAAAVARTNALYETGGFITLGYRGTFAFGRDGQADVKFRKLHRILVCGKAQLCREVFGDTLNESRDPDREGAERYTARLYLKHQCLERACDNLAEKGFRLITACSSGANGLVTAAVQPPGGGNNSQVPFQRESADMEEQRWAHFHEYVFYREPQFGLYTSPEQSPRN